MTKRSVLALDLGSTSGRGIVVRFDGTRLELEEISRFPTGSYRRNGHSCVNFPELWKQLRQSVDCAGASEKKLDSVGVDAWGLDMGMLDQNGQLIVDPFHYTDPMGMELQRKVYDVYPPEELFLETGTQPQCLKGLFSVVAVRDRYPALFDRCRSLLNLSDLFNYYLCGERRADRTVIGTSLMYSVPDGHWSRDVLNRFALPPELLSPETNPGHVIGQILPGRTERGTGVKVVLTCGHDTASAFLASGVTEEGPEIIISCGTRALIGTALPKANLSAAAFEKGFTNEIGFGGNVRFLRSCAGMSLFERLRRELASKGLDVGYCTLLPLAEQAPAFVRLIDPEDISFWREEREEDIFQTINRALEATGQPPAHSPGEFLRCVLESGACAWAEAADDLCTVLSLPFPGIRVVGGGGRNALAMQALADLTQLEVHTGPWECAAIGNAVTQLYALGEVESKSDIQQVLKSSGVGRCFDPHNTEAAEEAFQRYLNVVRCGHRSKVP